MRRREGKPARFWKSVLIANSRLDTQEARAWATRSPDKLEYPIRRDHPVLAETNGANRRERENDVFPDGVEKRGPKTASVRIPAKFCGYGSLCVARDCGK